MSMKSIGIMCLVRFQNLRPPAPLTQPNYRFLDVNGTPGGSGSSHRIHLPLYKLTRFSWCVLEGKKSRSLNAVGVTWSAPLGRPERSP